MKSEPLVSIMILGWNNYDDVINCLKSLKQISYKNYNVVLVDNGSKPANFDKFISSLNKSNTRYAIFNNVDFPKPRPQSLREQFFILKNDHNLGFTGGSNLGLSFTWKVCDPKYLLLLNGDTLVTPDFLDNLVKVCEEDKKIGSAQSVLIRFDKKTIDSLGIEMAGARAFDSCTGEDKSVLPGIKERREIFASCGASALYRADLIRRIGLFDEGLFATSEDFDLGWRIRLAGLKSILVKNSIVYHRGGVSRHRGNHVIFDMRSYLGAKNQLVMYNRYYPVSIKILMSSLVNLSLGLISAVKNKRTLEFLRILFIFPRQRRKVRENKRLNAIQKQWIK